MMIKPNAKTNVNGFYPETEKTFADYTTSYSNVRNLPRCVVPISIAVNAPEKWNGIEYEKLAPKWWFFQEWQENHDDVSYARNYYKEVLVALNPDVVWRELRRLSNNAPFALVCHENPSDFCHRHMVAEWLFKAGYAIKEFQ